TPAVMPAFFARRSPPWGAVPGVSLPKTPPSLVQSLALDSSLAYNSSQHLRGGVTMQFRFATILVLSFALFAQSDRGTLTGTITDPASAVVPAAKVTARNTETGAV